MYLIERLLTLTLLSSFYSVKTTMTNVGERSVMEEFSIAFQQAVSSDPVVLKRGTYAISVSFIAQERKWSLIY